MCSSAPLDKITPTDPRVTHQTFTTTSNITYHYLLAVPANVEPVGTVLLIHGFPDFSYGWRYQIPYLLSLNLRVVVPDMLGYARTDAPSSLSPYSLKSGADDMAQLMASVLIASPNKRFILGGHDWGGMFVWRFILYYPYLITGVFSVCTPYSAPREMYLPLEAITTYMPTFKYQLQFASGKVDPEVITQDQIRGFVNGMFGGRTAEGLPLFNTDEGINFDLLLKVQQSPLLSGEEVEYYVEEFARHNPPLTGPLNWYRTTRIKWEEELPLAQAKIGSLEKKIATPSLMINAKRDMALPPSMGKGMGDFFEDLTVREVDTSHWALAEDSVNVNKFIGEFVEGVLEREGRGKVKAAI